MTLSPPRWRTLLPQLALSVPELVIAFGFGFALFWIATALACRAVSPVCDSAGGLAVVVAGLGLSVLAGAGYWLLALSLGLAGRRRARYVLDAVAAAVAIGTFSVLKWQEWSTQAEHRAAVEAAASSEAATREAWIAALRQDPDAHGPPGVVPPMLRVIDDGRGVEVTNVRQDWAMLALARVREDNQGVWQACPLLTVGEVSDYYRFALGADETASFAPVPGCAAAFDGAPLEYRVGDPLQNPVGGWWSDSAFAAPNGWLP
jgi:hypothetical protein